MTRAKERLTLLHASSPLALRRAATRTCRRASSTSCRSEGVERERLRPASWSGYGAPRQSAGRAARRRARRSRPATPSATARSAPASSRGSSPTASSPSASQDGSERRLMLDYAPLEKI